MRIVIVGGGPAGMLAAISASKENNEVILIEKNEKLGKKLFITGKGRCNVTNNCDSGQFLKNVVRNSKFMYSAFNEFSNKDFMRLLEDNGCKLKVERGERVFPTSDKSYDIIDCLKNILKKQQVKVLLYTELLDIKIEENNSIKKVREIIVKDIKQNVKSKMLIDKLIITTGGLAYPSTGSTGDGYRFAKKLSIEVKPQSPSLVPLEVEEKNDCKAMQGLSLKNVAIKVHDKSTKKLIYNDFGEMLFTHFGLSGPIILSASCYIDDSKKYIISIDLKPALDYEKLDARLIREFEANKNKKLKTIMVDLLPSSMIDIFMERLMQTVNEETSVSDFENIRIAEVNKKIRKTVGMLLKDFKFTINKKRGYEEAIITKGGIDVKEINPKTMESKKIKGLYFAGEVLDVDSLTGGFNIQVAASTGYTAGLSI